MHHRIREVVPEFGHLFLFCDESQQLDDDNRKETQDNSADEKQRTEPLRQLRIGVVQGQSDGLRPVATDTHGLCHQRPARTPLIILPHHLGFSISSFSPSLLYFYLLHRDITVDLCHTQQRVHIRSHRFQRNLRVVFPAQRVVDAFYR